jgi:hypothetical protein
MLDALECCCCSLNGFISFAIKFRQHMHVDIDDAPLGLKTEDNATNGVAATQIDDFGEETLFVDEPSEEFARFFA